MSLSPARSVQRVHLRRAELTDAEKIYTVHTQAILELCSSMYSKETVEQWAARQHPNQYIPFIENQEITLAISPEGEVVGFVHLIVGNRHDSSDTCQVKGLFVSPKWARKGVGTVLLRHIEDQARLGGYINVSLQASLNAKKFYIKMGYTVVDSDDKHVCCDQQIKCILMNKTL